MTVRHTLSTVPRAVSQLSTPIHNPVPPRHGGKMSGAHLARSAHNHPVKYGGVPCASVAWCVPRLPSGQPAAAPGVPFVVSASRKSRGVGGTGYSLAVIIWRAK